MEAESDEAATQAGVEAAEEEKDEEAEEEDADGDDDGEEADAEDNGDDKPHESRKSLKRKLRAEQRAEWKAAQKVKQKQKRKGKRHKGPPLPPRTEAETQSGEHQKPSAEEVRTSRAARKAAELEDFRQRSALGTTVVLDLEWEQAMQEKELKSLLQQVLYCYGANRRASRPTRLVFSGVEPGSQTHAGLSKQAGYESWEVQKLSGAYVEAFPKERLVYLTADSEEVLESFDPEKVYIIGGIVDRNRLKGRTMEKALEQGIATAQLPLARHIEMGSYSRVLAVNHVMNMILDHQESGDWRGVCERCVPGRKKMLVQAEAESAAADVEMSTEGKEGQEVTTG